MIRFINCIRKRADVTAEQFRHYWNDPQFDAVAECVVKYTTALGYAKHLALIVSANELLQQQRAFGESYDGVLEYWWEDVSQLCRVLHSEECERLMQSMREYQGQFVDLDRSCAFFTQSETFTADALDRRIKLTE